MASRFVVNKKQIFTNTIYLYLRMFLVLLAGFFSVRVLLGELGVQDYGTYNLVFGFVTIFSILNGALSSMVKRFLCYELGRGNDRNLRTVFSVSFFFFLVLAIILVIGAETFGLWFTLTRLNFPPERLDAVKIIYQCAVATTVLKTLQIPYISVITAHERMSFFARLSILEAGLTLFSVLSLRYITADKLIIFCILYTLSALIVLGIYSIYSHRCFDECRLTLRFSRARISTMGSFFSYSALGAIANFAKDQGLNILLNLVLGVAYNATWALSHKVGTALAQIVTNFQTAFFPQIIKSYTNENKREFHELITSSSKYSFLLIWLFALPLLYAAEPVVAFWLNGIFPPDLILFIQLTILYFVVDAINGPLWMAAQANGKIKHYQITISILLFGTLPLSWFALKMWNMAFMAPLVALLINALSTVYRLLYLKKVYFFPVLTYCRKTLLPIFFIVLLSVGCSVLGRNFFADTTGKILLGAAGIGLFNLILSFCIALDQTERRNILSFCLKRGGNHE